MTEREAVEKLKNMRLFMQLEDNKNECKFTEDDYKANEMAIQALEKTAKKPRKNGLYSAHSGIFRKIPAYTCPSCGNMCLEKWATERSITSYCWDCGQKLDWSDVIDFENMDVNRQNEMLDSESDRIAGDSHNVVLNRVCYARGSSGTFVIDLNDPIETRDY